MEQTSLMDKIKSADDFVQESYERNDWLGKTMLTWYLMKAGHKVNVPKENFGIDMTSTKDGKQFHWEVEMKHNVQWVDAASFPYPTVSFLKRKQKMGDNFWYAILCADTQALLFARASDIFQEKFREDVKVNTKERQGISECYRVPKELCFWKNWKDMM